MSASSSGRLEFGFEFGKPSSPGRREPGASFSILVLADLSGRANQGQRQPLAGRPILKLDCDNFDRVLASHGPRLKLATRVGETEPLTLRFAALDDFHPDHLLKSIASLAELVSAWRLLKSPTAATEGAQKLEQILGRVTQTQEPASQPATPAESMDDTMARLLGKAPKSTPGVSKTGSSSGVQALINQIVGATGASASGSSSTSPLISAAELEMRARLQTILHHSDFQALEAAWRGLDFLVRRLPEDEPIKLSVMDVSLAELREDLRGLHSLLRDEPPNLVVGDYTFSPTKPDLETLGAIARLCASLNTNFLAAAHPHWIGCDSLAQHPDPDDWTLAMSTELAVAWQALRASPESARIGLALPRFLLRQPYGPSSDPIDTFGFEELPAVTEHETFLWGNPAFLCAYLLANASVGDPEDTGFSGTEDVGELPVFPLIQDGERTTKPCGEAWLVDRAVARIASQGFIALQSFKGRDAVRVVEIASIAQPRTRLA